MINQVLKKQLYALRIITDGISLASHLHILKYKNKILITTSSMIKNTQRTEPSLNINFIKFCYFSVAKKSILTKFYSFPILTVPSDNN